jgi:ATP-binding cassette, subfamily C, bacterial CydCD
MNLDPRLLRLIHLSKPAFILTLALGAAASILAVAQAWLLARLIDQVFLQGYSLPESSLILWLLLIAALLRSGAAAGIEAAAYAVARQVKDHLRSRLYRSLTSGTPTGTGQNSNRTGELTNTLMEGIESLEPYYSQFLPQLVLAVLGPVLILVFVFPVDLLSGVVLLLTAPLIPIFMILIGQASGSLAKKQWRSLSQLSAYFLDVLLGLTTLKTLGRSREQSSRLARASENFKEITLKVLRVTFLSSLALELVSTISTAVVAVQVGLRLLYGYIAFEQALFVLILAPEFYLPLRLLGARFHAGMAGAASAERIFHFLDQPTLAFRETSTFIEQPNLEPVSIVFKDVHFSYSEGRSALNGLSFCAPAGKITALVGTSGAGKSTVAALLLRFLQAESGQIEVGQIQPEHWRKVAAWVPQNPYLFNTTVAENIRLGKPHANMEEVIWAAKQANAHGFITALAQGYQTLLGERGSNLSGGQAQRIALARAFIKNAPVLILDEPTSSLDSQTESDLIDAVQRLAAGKTTLIIAHRLATAARADQILVLNEGLLVESGTHLELIEQGVLYPQLIQGSRNAEPARATTIPDRILPYQVDNIPRPQIHQPLDKNETLASSRSWQILLQFLAPYKFKVVASVLLGFATLGSGIGLMGASAYIISKAALRPSIADLQVAIVGVRFFGIARGVFRYLERYVTHTVTFSVLARLRTWFYECIEPLAPAVTSRYRSGDMLNRAIADIASLENFYVRAVAPPLAAVLAAIAALCYLGSFDLHLPAILAGFLIAAGLCVPFMILKAGREPGKDIVTARAHLASELVDGIQGLPDLLAFGQEDRQEEKITNSAIELRQAQTRMAWLSSWQVFFSTLLPHFGMLAVIALTIPLIVDGQILGVYLAVIALVALTSFEGTLPLGTAAQHLESSREASRRLFDLASISPEVSDPPNPLSVPVSFSLQVKRLYFRYPQQEQNDINWVINDLSFNLPVRGRLAVVGPSGAGKSTLANLILRFWDYCGPNGSGQILLNGQELAHYHPDELRRAVGVVSQNTYLFTGTIRDNLLLARPDAAEEEIFQASKLAYIHDFILTLPQGYRTFLGEGGMNLSAGQRQRLAIARALLAKPALLIFDEATANLDPLTESQVLAAVRSAIESCTSLTITHRLVGMEWMDEILVMKNGRVIERGRHQDLLEQGGLYRRMWELQNKWLV